MAYKNRSLIRRSVAMVRASDEEAALLDRMVEHYGGGASAEVFRDVLIKHAKALVHQTNSLSPSRLDSSMFATL